MDFKKMIEAETKQEYYKALMNRVDYEYETKKIYPPRDQILYCFEACDLSNLKVVILGQDPYHQAGQAMGLAFSVAKGIKIPPSLRNIYKELHDDVSFVIPNHGDLSEWAKQGVLLMNLVLTVEDSHAFAHQGYGWEIFTDHIMRYLNEYDKPLVFILWGKGAQSKAKCITNPKHKLIESVHPSPLSAYRGFFGSKPFSRANTYLIENQREPIDWSVHCDI